MSQTLVKQSLSNVDALTHAIADIRHVEAPYLEARLIMRKQSTAKAILDNELSEVEAKLNMWEGERSALESWSLQWFISFITCELQKEKDRCDAGVRKTRKLVEEARAKVNAMAEKNTEIESSNEKNAVDYRQLLKHRDDLTALLDEILGQKDYPTEKQGRIEIDNIRTSLAKLSDDDKKLAPVKELIKTADMALLEAIVDLRQSHKESMMAEGRIHFPESAYQAIKKAREIYPELPSIKQPTEYKNTPDETGAYYSPNQRYLWEVRSSLAALIEWCDAKAIENMEVETKRTIELGQKIDEWNIERRRLVKDVLLAE